MFANILTTYTTYRNNFRLKSSNILNKTYFNGKGDIPFIVFNKELTFKKGHIIQNHYCNDERKDILIKYCKVNGISMDNHGKHTKEYTDGRKRLFNFISLHINGKYLSGQSFHRVLTTAMTESGIEVKPKHLVDVAFA